MVQRKTRFVDLELKGRKNVFGFTEDPQQDFSFDAIISELKALEKRLHASSSMPSYLPKTSARELSSVKDTNRRTRPFVMHVSDSDMDTVIDSEEEEEKGYDHRKRAVGGRYTFDEDTLSELEDFDQKLEFGDSNNLMDATGLVEGTLFELLQDQRNSVMEEIRSQLVGLEADLVDENEKFISKLASVEKYAETKRGTERNLAMQYRRNIAEALDNHLTAVQRNHEQKSQIEEKRIRDDAIREEARRKEKALHDEKLRQERVKAETEMQARLQAERDKAAQAAAEEASKKAAKEAAEIEASEQRKIAAESITTSVSLGAKNAEAAGTLIKSTENALKVAEKRLKAYAEVAKQNDILRSTLNTQDYLKREQMTGRLIRTIRGSKENVWTKANALVELIADPSYPQSVSIAMVTEKLVSSCENYSGSFYAYVQVLVLVTSKVPLAMDLLIAELNRSCIYTVPKHLAYSKKAYESAGAYYKALGYRETDGKLEVHDTYLVRLRSCMKLYGALVQTEIPGTPNLHGIAEGWAWLARFLNALPPNVYTAVALQSFLEMAGFALYRKYRSQFMKMLRLIDRSFLSELMKKEDAELTTVIANIRNYIHSNEFLKEPKGWQLASHLESHTVEVI